MRRAAVLLVLAACGTSTVPEPRAPSGPTPTTPTASPAAPPAWGDRRYHLAQGLWELEGELRGGRGTATVAYHDGGTRRGVPIHLVGVIRSALDGAPVDVVHIAEDDPASGHWLAVFAAGELRGALFGHDAVETMNGAMVLREGRCVRPVLRDAGGLTVGPEECVAPPPEACTRWCPPPDGRAPAVVQVCASGDVYVGDRYVADESALRTALPKATPVSVIVDLEANLRHAPRVRDVGAWLARAGHAKAPVSMRLGVGCGCCEASP